MSRNFGQTHKKITTILKTNDITTPTISFWVFSGKIDTVSRNSIIIGQVKNIRNSRKTHLGKSYLQFIQIFLKNLYKCLMKVSKITLMQHGNLQWNISFFSKFSWNKNLPVFRNMLRNSLNKRNWYRKLSSRITANLRIKKAPKEIAVGVCRPWKTFFFRRKIYGIKKS